jgi:hypothetical protein
MDGFFGGYMRGYAHFAGDICVVMRILPEIYAWLWMGKDREQGTGIRG